MARLDGVDIAGYQEGIDIYDLTSDFVIVKATEGTQGTIYNPNYRDMLDAALDAIGLAGSYHYANGDDPIEEADCFYEAIRDYKGRIVPCLDWEGKGNRKFETGEDVEWCLAFMDRISERMGSSCLLYTSKTVCNEFDWSDVAERYPLWGAEYAYDDYTWQGWPDDPWQSSAPWGAWGDDVTIHQFGYLNPLPDNGGFDQLDGDVFYGTRSDWERMCGNGGEMAREGWAEDIDECVDPADFAYCTCEVYSCGYSQPNRRCLSREHLIDGDAETDCSAGVSWWLYKGGMLDECPWFATAYQVEYLTDLGWELLDPDEEEPRRNDVLWRPGHTALYIGDGMQAEALRTERHDAGYDGSIPGDQDGGETMVREYPAGGWVWIIRSPDSLPEQRREEQDIPDEGDGAVYRFRDPGNGIHFLTASHDEAVSVSSWMDYEGVAFRVSGSGQTVYRLYDEGNGDHFLTTSKSERDTAKGWMADEGVAFRTEGTRPVYRLIDRNDNTHFYTASRAERDACMDWMDYEGVAFSVLSEDGSVTYRAHCQTLGWLGWVSDGEVAGTLGERRRMEAIEIELPDGMVVDAMAHVQRLGDQWVRDASGRFTLGTTGRSLRIEGIMLDVKRSQGQSLRYRCHVQRIGWTDWCESGTFCGTRGQGLRVEAVQIMLS